MQKESPIISFDNVMLNYGNNAPILKNISISFFKKSFHFLTGVSGAGKSSFLKLIYAGMKPSSGKIKIFDEDITQLSPEEQCKIRQNVGVIFQNFNLLNHLTVLENVALPLKVMGESNNNRELQAKEILDWVGLGECFYLYPDVLSGGQKQRVAIARAVITRPQILLADEPTGNVDSHIADKLVNLFYGMYKMGTCVIIATHCQQFSHTFPYNEVHIEKNSIVVTKNDLPDGNQ